MSVKQIKQDGLIYLIKEKEKRADIIGYYEDRRTFIIPRSIKHESQEYIVVSISKNAFKNSVNIESIEFVSDSEVQSIEKDAFRWSQIESIFIPASVNDLQKGWCNEARGLKKIKIDPKNPRYSYLDGKMIIYKTSETNQIYDKIVFVQRDIKEITIPSFIKTIGSDAFKNCYQLHKIDIPTNSELQIIEDGAFQWSSIESIFIPPHVTKICEDAFKSCSKLRQIEIPTNSELQIIEDGAFQWSSIERIFIPPHVTKLCKNTFTRCTKLRQIDIPSNSELQIIENCALEYTPIESIFIPASVIDIKENWCSNINKLTTFDVDPRNLRYSNYEGKMIIGKSSETSENFDKIVFARRDIKNAAIPSFIKTVGSYAFSFCYKFQRIDIPLNSELQTIECEAFFCASFRIIFIPHHVKKISTGAFSYCKNLQRIIIPSNSKLQTIGRNAFAHSLIESIFIPPHVTKLCDYTFSHCYNLRQVDIPSNSELQTIEQYAFLNSLIHSIFIPSHVTKISKYAFEDCINLKLIEIGEKSDIELYNISSIFPKDSIIMIPIQ